MSLEKQRRLGDRYRFEAESDINLALKSGVDPMQEYLLALAQVSGRDAEADSNECQLDASKLPNGNVDSVNEAADCFEALSPVLKAQFEGFAA